MTGYIRIANAQTIHRQGLGLDFIRDRALVFLTYFGSNVPARSLWCPEFELTAAALNGFLRSAVGTVLHQILSQVRIELCLQRRVSQLLH